jgi:hypothetical protein
MLPEFEIMDDKQPVTHNPRHRPMRLHNNSSHQISMYHDKIHLLEYYMAQFG